MFRSRSRVSTDRRQGVPALFGNRPDVHQLLAEYRVRTYGRGRTVDEWKLIAGRENYLFDALRGATVAASVRGVTPAETAPTTKCAP